MSTPGPRHHIPFPTNFLSLNARLSKGTATNTVDAPQEETPAHSFLSNRQSVPRSGSISSASSAGSAPSSPPTKAADASPEKSVPTLHSFLALNTKVTPPPTTAAAIAAPPGPIEKHSFLSNKQ